MKAIKRDGKYVDFDSFKIRKAITSANSRTSEMSDEDIKKIVDIVINKCNRLSNKVIRVEDIQDIINSN